MTSFAPCGIGFIGVQLPCADASPDNIAHAIAATSHGLINMSLLPNRDIPRAPLLERFCAEPRIRSSAPAWGCGLRDDERPHHVVFFVFEDVAVPHVFMAAS